MSPAMAGGFLTTVPPGKPRNVTNSFIYLGVYQNILIGSIHLYVHLWTSPTLFLITEAL